MNPKVIAAGLSQFVPVPGRCSILQIGEWTVVDDTYNASPLAVAAACRTLTELSDAGRRRRLLILGDMRELGETAAHEHEVIGGLVAQLGIERLLVCGEHANDFARGAHRFGMSSHQIVAANDTETLLAVLDCWLEPNDVLLIKGSRATRMERVIEWLQVRAQSQQTWDSDIERRICA